MVLGPFPFAACHVLPRFAQGFEERSSAKAEKSKGGRGPWETIQLSRGRKEGRAGTAGSFLSSFCWGRPEASLFFLPFFSLKMTWSNVMAAERGGRGAKQ